jgi:tetratricopeptide (TPR) repeat protein
MLGADRITAQESPVSPVPSQLQKPSFSSARPRLRRALQSLLAGDRKAAIEEYNQALKSDPNDAQSYLNRGAFYLLSEEYIKSINDLQKASKLFSEQGNEKLSEQAKRMIDIAQRRQSS